MTPADVLDAAADYIDEHGWTQFEFQDRGGCVCAVGAIDRVAAFEPLVTNPAMRALRRATGPVGISVWNDRLDQTAENVTATMRRVAAELREAS